LEATEQSRITDAVIAECERLGDRFAILGVPGLTHASALSAPRDTALGATYYPWIWVRSDTGEPTLIPAVGHIAGAYAKSDLEHGIHNSSVGRELYGLLHDSQTRIGSRQFQVASDEIDRLKRMGINAIACEGGHVRMQTAITMSIDHQMMDLATERLLLFIKKSIYFGATWALFETNDEQLWAELRARMSEFLKGVWESGALSGRTAGEAFFVRCGRDTMTQADIDNRRIVILLDLSLRPSGERSALSFALNQAW
jgi:phage tail sheath protein FI